MAEEKFEAEVLLEDLGDFAAHRAVHAADGAGGVFDDLNFGAEAREYGLHQVVGRRADGRLEELRDTFGVVMQLREQVTGDERIVREVFEVGVDDAFDLVVEGCVGTEMQESREDAGHYLRKDGLAESLLVAKVVVQQGLVDARFLGDLGHSCAGSAPLDEDGSRGLEDPLLGFGVLCGSVFHIV